MRRAIRRRSRALTISGALASPLGARADYVCRRKQHRRCALATWHQGGLQAGRHLVVAVRRSRRGPVGHDRLGDADHSGSRPVFGQAIGGSGVPSGPGAPLFSEGIGIEVGCRRANWKNASAATAEAAGSGRSPLRR
jgi:hypothetical protein